MDLADFDRLWDYQDPAGTEVRFRELLPLARRAGDDGTACELLTQIARTVCLRRRYEAALALVDQAEALLDGPMERPRIRCLLERGRILNDMGRTARALSLFEQAWEIAHRTDERILGRTRST